DGRRIGCGAPGTSHGRSMFSARESFVDPQAPHVLRLRRLGSRHHLNDYPPAVAYLFGKQIYDESTHEMQYLDEILRRRWVRTQRKFFEHPYGQFATASRVSAYIFCLRALANYPQNLRIAALNLGPKVIELAWTE